MASRIRRGTIVRIWSGVRRRQGEARMIAGGERPEPSRRDRHAFVIPDYQFVAPGKAVAKGSKQTGR